MLNKIKPDVLTQHGYFLRFVGKKHHLAHINGYAYVHRIVAEEKLGRRLLPGEIAHHIDGNKQNNEKENISIFKGIAHHKEAHRKPDSRLKKVDEPNIFILCSCGCGAQLLKYDGDNRERSMLPGHQKKNKIFNPKRHDKTIVSCRCGCGSEFTLRDKWGRKREFLSGHNAKVKEA